MHLPTPPIAANDSVADQRPKLHDVDEKPYLERLRDELRVVYEAHPITLHEFAVLQCGVDEWETHHRRKNGPIAGWTPAGPKLFVGQITLEGRWYLLLRMSDRLVTLWPYRKPTYIEICAVLPEWITDDMPLLKECHWFLTKPLNQYGFRT